MDLLIIKIIILSIIQGISEWLPISSSGILIIFEDLLDLNDEIFNFNLNVIVHFGSLLAVITYFFNDLKNLFKNKKLLKNIIIATVPVIIVGGGLSISDFIFEFQNLKTVAFATVFFAIVMYFCDKVKIRKKFQLSIPFKDSLYIGLSQIFALIPGTSRSGITISCARLLGYSRVDATKFSFLISIPAILGANSISFTNTNFINLESEYFLLLLAFLVSYFVSLITIKSLLKFLQKYTLNVFVIFRIFLGFALVFFSI